MPWKPQVAKKHNKKAVGKKAKQWSATANAVLEQTGDEAKAIRIANVAIKKEKKK